MKIIVESTSGIDFLDSDCIQSLLIELNQEVPQSNKMIIYQHFDQEEPNLYHIQVLLVTNKQEILRSNRGRDAHLCLANTLREHIRIAKLAGAIELIPIRKSGFSALQSAS